MEKKYELTDVTMELKNGTILHRIIALRDFADVKSGTIGGWIEKEFNLSHEGNCWVYGESKVFNNARVFENARIYGRSRVYDRARVFGNAIVRDYVDIYDKAIVCDNARIDGDIVLHGTAMIRSNAKVVYHGLASMLCISGNTLIDDNAYIRSNDDFVTFDNIGSRNDATTFYNTKDKGIYVKCGCFIGSIDEFKEAVIRKHKDNKYAEVYLGIIEVAKIKLSK